ncbi:11374_t:CDS:2, partial [Paraglomus brasilianum]
ETSTNASTDIPVFNVPEITIPKPEKIDPISLTTNRIEKDQPEYSVASSSKSTDISMTPEIEHVEPSDDKHKSPEIIEESEIRGIPHHNEVFPQQISYPPGYQTREQREKRLRQWAIDHNEDPDKFVTITDKDKTDSIDYLTRIDVDANTCLFNIEQGNDPHDFMEMTHRERLIGEEILRRRLEDAGESIWLDTDEEWIKNKTILQENGLLWGLFCLFKLEAAKHLGYDIREVRDGVARSSNAGSGISKPPQNYNGTVFELWEEIDALFNEKKRVEKRSMARLYPKKS